MVNRVETAKRQSTKSASKGLCDRLVFACKAKTFRGRSVLPLKVRSKCDFCPHQKVVFFFCLNPLAVFSKHHVYIKDLY